MASIVLSSVGNYVGNMIMPGVGGSVLGTLAGQAGGVIDEKIGLTNDTGDGVKLESFAVQDSKYGLAIPVIFGRARVAGNVIWASDLIETSHEEGGLGKGGVSGISGSSSTSYTYSIHVAVALGEGEIGGIQTIWADSKVIYQNGVWKEGVVGSATIYAGAEDQEVDPLLESWVGTGRVPAYRGLAYVVFDSLQLSNFGNRLPNLSFEILPKVATGEPQWIGACDPFVKVSGYSCRSGGALPLTIEGGNVSARRILTCGYLTEDDMARFVVCEMDVTGDEPVELSRAVSDAFPVVDVATHTWALAPDKRFVAIGFQDGAVGKPFYVMIYDSQTRSFGAITSYSMALLEYRQIAWIDQQRFIFTETQGDVRGVRVLMRSGVEAVDFGFHNVWFAGSTTSRQPLNYAQFVSYADGLIHITGNAAPIFSVLYATHLSWVNNELVVMPSYVLSSGVSLGTGSASQNFLMAVGEDEWAFVHTSTNDMSFMSFRAGKEEAEITRSWQKFATNVLFGPASCQFPVVFGNRVLVVQKSYYDNRYLVSEVEMKEGAFSLEVSASPIADFEDAMADFSAFYIGANRLMVLGGAYSGSLAHLGLVRRRNTGDTLDNVVGNILLRAGYESGDFDVSALAGIPLDGYVVSRQIAAASSLSLLKYFEPFDLVECDGLLKAVRRGGGESIDVDPAEAGAKKEKAFEKDVIPWLSVRRVQELDLPVELTVDTIDASRDYEIGSQRARRLSAKGGPRAAKLSLPLVCTASDAKRLAERVLYSFWAQRTSYRLYLSSRWLALNPADVVVVEGCKIRVTEIAWQDGVLKVDGVEAEADGLLSGAVAEGGESANGFRLDTVPSILCLMDLPLLRNEDDGPGVYVAVSGGDGWSGASLWRSPDGVDFTQKSSFTKAAIAGSAVTVLSDCSSFYRDEVSTVRVQLYQGILSSCSESQMLNGANAALLGGEIIQFQSAILVGPGLYELSHFLRGRHGTEEGCQTHSVGEAFVLLSSSTVQFLPALAGERNQSFSFRAVSFGGSLATAQNLSLTYGMRSLQPLAPVHLKGMRSGGIGSDVVIRWVRRARMNGAWMAYIDVPLDEAQELYDLEIMEGERVVRVFENVGSTSQVYSRLQQVEDWPLGVPECFSVKVYQISGCYGRGQAAVGTV